MWKNKKPNSNLNSLSPSNNIRNSRSHKNKKTYQRPPRDKTGCRDSRQLVSKKSLIWRRKLGPQPPPKSRWDAGIFQIAKTQLKSALLSIRLKTANISQPAPMEKSVFIYILRSNANSVWLAPVKTVPISTPREELLEANLKTWWPKWCKWWWVASLRNPGHHLKRNQPTKLNKYKIEFCIKW